MEFKLNKIDTDIRNKIKEETREEKVHSAKEINTKKDIKDEKKQSDKESQNSTKEKQRKRYITIDGIRYSEKNININAEKLEELNYENAVGRVLDIKK
ncbi:hypothetical protein [uncultured Clostridium sp.]|uniref:hypothetical protein n=1 Tax=uncultured Clostridium sp. TaxID=59620 RepID=UPI0028EDE20E|nr:hypothetical protein [uncultured Clostridium sp.]